MKQTGIINRIHKGLRTWLFETGIMIQQTDFILAEEGMKAITLLRKVLQVADRKSSIDEMHVLPVMVLHAPYMVSLMDAEIQKMKEINERLTGYIGSYMQPGTEAYRATTGFSIQQVYSEFMGSVLIYMNRLESLINEIYSAVNHPESLDMINAAQLMHIDGANRLVIEEWIYKGMSNREIASWLGEVRHFSGAWLKAGMEEIAAGRNKAFERESGKMKMAAA